MKKHVLFFLIISFCTQALPFPVHLSSLQSEGKTVLLVGDQVSSQFVTSGGVCDVTPVMNKATASFYPALVKSLIQTGKPVSFVFEQDKIDFAQGNQQRVFSPSLFNVQISRGVSLCPADWRTNLAAVVLSFCWDYDFDDIDDEETERAAQSDLYRKRASMHRKDSYFFTTEQLLARLQEIVGRIREQAGLLPGVYQSVLAPKFNALADVAEVSRVSFADALPSNIDVASMCEMTLMALVDSGEVTCQQLYDWLVRDIFAALARVGFMVELVNALSASDIICVIVSGDHIPVLSEWLKAIGYNVVPESECNVTTQVQGEEVDLDEFIAGVDFSGLTKAFENLAI